MPSARNIEGGAMFDRGRIVAAYRNHQSAVWIAVISIIVLIVSYLLYLLDLGQWFSEAAMNIGFLGLALVAAFWIGESLIKDAERRQWSSVEEAIQRRAIRAAMAALGGFIDAPTIRAHLLLEYPEGIPPYSRLVADPSCALEFYKERLGPAISAYTSLRPPPRHTTDFLGFSIDDWTKVNQGISRTLFHTAQTIILFGSQTSPALQAATIDLDDRATKCVDALSQWNTHRSGQGEMAYQVSLLECFDETVTAAGQVLQVLSTRNR